MKRLPTIVVTAFAVGFMVALVIVSGCSEAANRTLNMDYDFEMVLRVAETDEDGRTPWQNP